MLFLIVIIDPNQKLNQDSGSVRRLLRRSSGHYVDLVTPPPPPPPHTHTHTQMRRDQRSMPLIVSLGLICVNKLQCSNMIWMVI